MPEPQSFDFATPLPTVAQARQRRDHSMSDIEVNTPEPWRAAADRAIDALARGTEFLAEQIREQLDREGLVVHDRRALGPLMMQAARQGRIERIGFRRAVTSNLSPKVLWRKC